MKRETGKIYKTLLSFLKSTISPMGRWSFVRAGFFLQSENLLGPIRVDGTKALERIEVSELPVDEAFICPETIDWPPRPGTQTRRRALIPGPTSFAISLAAYIEKATRICSLCGHDEDAKVSDDEDREID